MDSILPAALLLVPANAAKMQQLLRQSQIAKFNAFRANLILQYRQLQSHSVEDEHEHNAIRAYTGIVCCKAFSEIPDICWKLCVDLQADTRRFRAHINDIMMFLESLLANTNFLKCFTAAQKKDVLFCAMTMIYCGAGAMLSPSQVSTDAIEAVMMPLCTLWTTLVKNRPVFEEIMRDMDKQPEMIRMLKQWFDQMEKIPVRIEYPYKSTWSWILHHKSWLGFTLSESQARMMPFFWDLFCCDGVEERWQVLSANSAFARQFQAASVLACTRCGTYYGIKEIEEAVNKSNPLRKEFKACSGCHISLYCSKGGPKHHAVRTILTLR